MKSFHNEAAAAAAAAADAELIAEAKQLSKHKTQLEVRMRILEDHNRQLDAQLQRLRLLLDQVMYAFSTPHTFSLRKITCLSPRMSDVVVKTKTLMY